MRLMPSLSNAFSHISNILFPVVRSNLLNIVKRLDHYENQPNFMTNYLKGSVEPAYKTCVDIILKSYTLFSLNPGSFLQGYVYLKNYQEDPVFYAVTHCAISYNPDIRKITFKFAWSFLEYDNLTSYDPAEVSNDPDHQIFALFLQLGKFAQILVQNVIQNELSEAEAREHLILTKGLMKGRCVIAEQYQFAHLTDREITSIEPSDIRFEISNVIEMSALILILSKDIEICKIALEILNSMVQEALICENLEYPESSHWSIVNNFVMYSELSSPSYIFTGAIAIHKRLYQSLQSAKANTRAIIDAWKILNSKWKSITETLKTKSSTDYDLARTWRAYSGFLASTVSPWIVVNNERGVEGNLSKSSKSFLLEILDLVTNVNSSYLREMAREILSRDTNHSAYHFIFTALEEKLKTLSQGNLKLSETGFLLLEQSVLFLRAIIEYINDGEVYLAVDISSLALSIVKKLDALTLTDRVLKLRIMYAGLVSSISSHTDSMNIKHDLEIRNEIVMIFCGWLDHNISYNYSDDEIDSVVSADTSRSERRLHGDSERLQKDCIVAIIDSLAGISLKLSIEVPYGTHEKDVYETKCNKFSIIFMLLVRVLEKCRIEESHLRGSLMLGEHLETVKKKTIEILSKLLDTNVDVGLKMALPLALHEDTFIRVSFIKILDNILSHSSKLNNNDPEVDPYETLSEFLVENVPVAVSLCDVCPATEVDEFSTAILAVFESRNNSLGLVKTVVTREVERADTPMEILRRNCVATKILSIYTHSKGLAYLRASLGPFIQEIIDSPEDHVFETNPDKIPEGQTVEENIARFQKTLKNLLQSLENALDYIPSVFREICHTIASTGDAKYAGKNASVSALSAFFFLRFVCPSLVTPESDILSDCTPSRDVKRTLLILAKMVQNLAYGTSSFVKISIFKNYNISLAEESATIVRILKKLTDIDTIKQSDNSADENTPQDSPTSSQVGIVKPVDKSYLENIHRFLYNHWEDINHRRQTEIRMKKHAASTDKRSVLSHRQSVVAPLIDSRSNNASSHSTVVSDEDNDYRILQKLTLIVRSLGRPKTSEKKPDNDFNMPNAPTFTPRLREFLERNASRDMGPIIEKHIIHEGLSREGMPLLILTAKNYTRESLDTELVVCRFFQVVSKMMNQKFALFYDATEMTVDNLLPTSATSVVSMIAPDLMSQNCVAVYFYNVPDDMVPALRNSFRPLQTGTYLNPMTTKYQFITSRDIQSKFNLGTLNLDPTSEHVATEMRVDFKGIVAIDTEKQKRKLVSLHLGNEYLQIHTDEPFQFNKGAGGFANTVFHLSEIVRVELSSAHPGELVVVIGSGKSRKVVLRSNSKTHAHEIVRSIANAKSRLSKTSFKFSNNGDTQLYQTLESSLGSFLNISFASLCSTDPSSKTAAYNLLATVQSRFKLDLGGMELVRGRGIRLPANVFMRVQKYSTSIANTRPELTFDVIEEMFPAFQKMPLEIHQGALMYITPWVKQLATNVLECEPKKFKKGTTARIIRQFLELSLGSNRDYMYMLQSVWPLVMAESRLLPILIEEVLSLVLESNFVGSSGKKEDNVIAILTSYQSVEACENIINQILDIAMESACVKNNSLVNHPQWQEIVVLVSILSAMLFENPEVATKHCSKICFIVEMFLYTGPYSFRLSLYNLLVNMIHSFLYNDSISSESMAHIMTLWKDLTSNKGNMIFGISDEMKNLAYDYPVTSIIFQIEACSTMLSELIRCVSTGTQLERYHDQSSQLCLQLCTQRYSILQSRAVVALGCTKYLDVDDETVTTILEVFYDVISTPETKMRTELITCCAFCISRLANGLRVDSKYYGYLFWVAMALLNTQNMKIFGYGLQLLQTVTKSLDDYGVFKQISMGSFFMTCRNEFKEEWQRVERMCDVAFSRPYFEHCLAFMLLPGIVKSSTKAATMATFDTLLTISARNHQYREGPMILESSHVGETFSILSGISGYTAPALVMKYIRPMTSSTSIATSNSTSNNNNSGTPGVPHSVGSIAADCEGPDDASTTSVSASKSHLPYMIYLFFLYLCSRSQSDWHDYMWIAGFPEDQTADQEIPIPIQRYLSSNHPRTVMALYMGALVYNETEDEEVLGQRYLEVLNFIGPVNIRNYFRLYFVVRPKVKRTIDVGTSIEVVKVALECAKTTLLNFDELQKPAKYLMELDEILAKVGIGSSKHTGMIGGTYGYNGSARGSAFSNKPFFGENEGAPNSFSHSALSSVAVGISPTSLGHSGSSSNGNTNIGSSGTSHGLAGAETRSTLSSSTTGSSGGSNLGSSISANIGVTPHEHNHALQQQPLNSFDATNSSHHRQPHPQATISTTGIDTNSQGRLGGDIGDNRVSGYPDHQLGVFIEKLIEVAKLQCHSVANRNNGDTNGNSDHSGSNSDIIGSKPTEGYKQEQNVGANPSSLSNPLEGINESEKAGNDINIEAKEEVQGLQEEQSSLNNNDKNMEQTTKLGTASETVDKEILK